jgi:hypothetical protein
MLTREEHIDFAHALGKAVGSATAFCLAITVIWPVGALLTYHVRLLYLNVTTIEQVWRPNFVSTLVLSALSFPITPLCAKITYIGHR